MSNIEFNKGQRVKLVDVHHKHNDGLKENKNGKGTITSVIKPRGEYLVKFDKRHSTVITNKWWVKGKWLEPVENDE